MKRPRSLSLFRDGGAGKKPPAEVAPATGEPVPETTEAAAGPAGRRGLLSRNGKLAAPTDAPAEPIAPTEPMDEPAAPPEAPAEPGPPTLPRKRLWPFGRRSAAGSDAVQPEEAEATAAPRKRLWPFGRRRKAGEEDSEPADGGFSDLPPERSLPSEADVARAVALIAENAAETLFEIDDQQRLVEKGRKRYAAGLLWLPLDPERKIAQQAADAAFGDDPPNLYAVTAGREQIGFGYKYNGLRSGMPVAATLFSPEVLPGNWLAVFALDGETGPAWWLVAWRDGQVYEDRVLTDEGDAQGAFRSLQEAPNWSITISPPTWDVPDSFAYDLGTVLGKRKRPVTLRSTSQLQALLPLAAAVAGVAVLGVGGYFAWQALQPPPPPPPVVERPPPPPEPVVPPWVGMPMPQQFVDLCAPLFEETLIFPTGWRLEPQTCRVDGGNVVVETTWQRDGGGRMAWFIATLRGAGFEDLGISADLRSGTVFGRAPIGPTEMDADIVALSADEVEQRLRLRFDTLALPLSMRLVAPRAAPNRPSGIGGLGGQAQTPVAWSYHEITFTESTGLSDLIRLVSDIPATVPERLTYDVYSQNWTLVLRLYHEAR